MIDNLVINNLTLGSVASGYYFTKLAGFEFPELRIDIKDRGNYDGARLGTYNYGRRIMSVEGELWGSTATDYESKRRALQLALGISNGLTTLTINTKSGLTLEASVILNVQLGAEYQKGNIIFGSFRIEFVAPYPFLLSSTSTNTQVDPYTGGGGAIPSAIPFSLGVGGSGAETINNAGNGTEYPTIKIYGSIENPSMQNTTTGKQFSLSYNLSTSTDYIEIDTYNQTVLLNGVTNIRQYFSGDFITLEAGDNEIKLTSASYDSNAHAIVTHKDSYLGI